MEYWLFVIAVVFFTFTATVTDLSTRKLPNWLTVPAFLAALVFHTVTGGLVGLGNALGGFAIGFGILLILWLIGGGGGGDVKLMGALGAWLGPVPILIVFTLSAVLALLFTCLAGFRDVFTHGFSYVKKRYLMHGEAQPRRKKSESERLKQRQKKRVFPYALPVGLATWALLAWQIVTKTAGN